MRKLIILQQIEPAIRQPFRIAENVETLDGIRTRMTDRCFTSIEEARGFIRRMEEENTNA